MPHRWNAVDGLVRALGALRAESFALEHDPVEPTVLAEAARTIGDAAQAVGATLDAPEDTGRLMGACEAIVVAHERIEALLTARGQLRDYMELDADPRRAVRRLLEQIQDWAAADPV
jgi:hypothetical protein